MRKNFLTILYVFILIIAIYLVQFYVINPRELFGVKPNLILIIVIEISLWYGMYVGGISSLLIGVITDIIYGSNFGVYTLAYLIAGIIVGALKSNYRKESKMSLVYVTVISTFVFEIILGIQYLLMYRINFTLIRYIKQSIISSLLNIVIVYIIYSLMYKISEYLEDRIIKNSSGF